MADPRTSYTIDIYANRPVVLPAATESSAGLMTAADKTKLDNVVAIRHVILQADGTDYNVAVPLGVMQDGNYAPGGWVENSALDTTMQFPNGVGDRTATQFRVKMTGALNPGDTVIFHLVHF